MDGRKVMMEHGITPAEWLGYLDGSLPAVERDRVRAHLDVCEGCRQTNSQVLAWEAAVRDEAKQLTRALARQPQEIDGLARQLLERIRNSEQRPDAGVSFRPAEAVLLLRALLDPLCGTGAARNAGGSD